MEGYIPCNMSEISESDDRYECPICFYKIEDDSPYSMIDNCNEKGKFHIECLEKWLTLSNNGLFTQDQIKKYSNYQNDKKIESIKVPPRTLTNYAYQSDPYANYPNTRSDHTIKHCCIII